MPRQNASRTTSDSSPPRSVTEVLCREVGARHPDGALKQIRTMKRLLRSHYRVQQRLEEYGVDSLDEAVSRIATLTRQLDTAREQQRQRAKRRLTVIETLLDKMDVLRPQARASSTPSPSTASDAPSPLDDALDLVEALAAELDELRLDLWLHQSEEETDAAASPGENAVELVDRLDDALQKTKRVVDRLQKDRESLRDENERLQREVNRLRRTVDQQQSRIETLERSSPDRHPTPTDL